MGRKSKGINAERELLHLFWNAGWACIRVAGSGAARYPTPDVLAGNGKRALAIECKSSKGYYQYLEKQEIADLKRFSGLFGAEPWVGVRFSNEGWRFFRTSDMNQTGIHFGVTRNTKGRSFLELIS